jgi:hypothetical protein
MSSRGVVAERVKAKIPDRVSPDGVDMVSAVLGVVVLHQERGPLQAVVVATSALAASCPGEMYTVAA